MQGMASQTKLTIGLLLAFMFVLVGAFVGFAMMSLANEKSSQINKVLKVGTMVAEDLARAIKANDEQALAADLRKLYVMHEVTTAIVYNHDGNLISQWKKRETARIRTSITDRPSIDKLLRARFQFHNEQLEVGLPIMTGTSPNLRPILYIQTEPRFISSQFQQSIKHLAAILICLLTTAVFVVIAIRMFITNLIGRLAKQIRLACVEGHFDQTIITSGDDCFTKLESMVNCAVEKLQESDEYINSFDQRVETQVKARTAGLETAVQKAKASVEAKSAFLANMSHEIRTPLNGIIGMTEMLLTTKLKETQYYYANIVLQSGEVLLQIINDILDFSKNESGKQKLESIDFDLRDLIEDTIALLVERAAGRNNQLITFVSPKMPCLLRGDTTRVRQIITNLVGNAIKFTEDGDITVRVSDWTEEPDGISIKFEIKDSGIGIDAKKKESIFEAFSQEDVSTTRRYGGTGLGLTICKQLVELMGGEIGVESKIGEGSLFWFTAKFSKQPNVPINFPECAVDNASKKVVLMVNSEPLAQSLSVYLAAWGLSVTSVSKKKEVYLDSKLEESDNSKTLLITDVFDKYSDKIKQLMEQDDNLRVISINANKGFENNQGQLRGAQVKLTVPFKTTVLAKVVEQVNSGKILSEEQHLGGEDSTLNRFDARVLVAEDNHVNQKVVKLKLVHYGCTVDLVENGKQAVAAVKKRNYDLVFMDCQMPEMDGFIATQKIRDSEKANQKPLPIIALTANATNEDKRKCFDAGMNDFLSKPFKQNKLYSILGQWLGNKIVTADSQEAHNEDNLGQEPTTVAASENEAAKPASNSQSKRKDVIHQNVIDDICGLEGGKEILEEIIDEFMKESQQSMNEIGKALKSANLETVAYEAHKLKSSCANVGAMQMSTMCKKLEGYAKDKTPQNIPMIFDQVTDEFELVKQALAKYRSVPSE